MKTDEITSLRIGDRVRFTHRLQRKSEHRPLEPDELATVQWEYLRSRFEGRKLWLKWWKPFEVDGVEGRVVGVRHYRNGVNSYGGYDEPITFEHLAQFPVVLVAYSLHDNPAAVLPEHLARLDEVTSDA
jgi:hypothetical protein